MTLLRHLLVAVSAVAACAATPAFAGDYLTLSAGKYDVFDSGDSAAQFGLEYRFREWKYDIHPIVGGFFTSDESKYVYAGANWEVEALTNQLYIIPNFAVGAYSAGNGKKLGGTLEFRSGIEVDYQFENKHRLGVALNHISNASIYDRNPGEETLMATYSLPLDLFR